MNEPTDKEIDFASKWTIYGGEQGHVLSAALATWILDEQKIFGYGVEGAGWALNIPAAILWDIKNPDPYTIKIYLHLFTVEEIIHYLGEMHSTCEDPQGWTEFLFEWLLWYSN